MGNKNSKPNVKYNKNHLTKKGFQFGLSFGKSDLTMEGNIQIGWTNKTVKNYTKVVKEIKNEIVEKDLPENIKINAIENIQEET